MQPHDLPTVEETLLETAAIEAVSLVGSTNAETLFRVQWSTTPTGVVGHLVDAEAAVLEGIGAGDEWTFSVRFPSSDRLSTFYQRCLEDDIAIDVTRINGEAPVFDGGAFRMGLTTAQRELLETALEAGYFDVPRRITLSELGERFGISDSAASQRLRRGLSEVLEVSLAPGSCGSGERN